MKQLADLADSWLGGGGGGGDADAGVVTKVPAPDQTFFHHPFSTRTSYLK